MKKLILASVAMVMMVTGIAGCTQADKVSHNVSEEADNFNVIRRLTVINARTDKPMFELVGAFSIYVDNEEKQLEVVVETGKNEYKKHFVNMNQWTMYVIEDISGASVSRYHYEVNFQPEAIVPVKFTNKD